MTVYKANCFCLWKKVAHCFCKDFHVPSLALALPCFLIHKCVRFLRNSLAQGPLPRLPQRCSTSWGRHPSCWSDTSRRGAAAVSSQHNGRQALHHHHRRGRGDWGDCRGCCCWSCWGDSWKRRSKMSWSGGNVHWERRNGFSNGRNWWGFRGRGAVGNWWECMDWTLGFGWHQRGRFQMRLAYADANRGLGFGGCLDRSLLGRDCANRQSHGRSADGYLHSRFDGQWRGGLRHRYCWSWHWWRDWLNVCYCSGLRWSGLHGGDCHGWHHHHWGSWCPSMNSLHHHSWASSSWFWEDTSNQLFKSTSYIHINLSLCLYIPKESKCTTSDRLL